MKEVFTEKAAGKVLLNKISAWGAAKKENRRSAFIFCGSQIKLKFFNEKIIL